MIAEHAPQHCHGLIHRIVRDNHPGPDLIKQPLHAHHLTGVPGQAQKELHRPAPSLAFIGGERS